MGTDSLEERRKKVTLKRIERKHAGKIQQPYKILEELIERYGLEMCTGIDGQEILDHEKAEAEFEVAAEENDAKRPLLKAAETGEWRRLDVAELGIPPRVATKLHDAGKGTLGDLVDLMRAEESWWHKAVPGVGQESAGAVNDALAKFRKDHPEYEGL